MNITFTLNDWNMNWTLLHSCIHENIYLFAWQHRCIVSDLNKFLHNLFWKILAIILLTAVLCLFTVVLARKNARLGRAEWVDPRG